MSTTRVLHVAAQEGVPIHRVTGQNVDAELQRLQLPEAVEQRIATAVARPGVEVVVPEREVTVGGWSGVGYVVSGGSSTDYRISGGISGGAAANPGPDSTSEALAAGVPRHTERTKQASDCDEAKIVILALIALLMVIAILALVYFYAGPMVTVHLFAWGMVLDFPLAPLIGGNALIGFVAAAGAWDEYEEC